MILWHEKGFDIVFCKHSLGKDPSQADSQMARDEISTHTIHNLNDDLMCSAESDFLPA